LYLPDRERLKFELKLHLVRLTGSSHTNKAAPFPVPPHVVRQAVPLAVSRSRSLLGLSVDGSSTPGKRVWPAHIPCDLR